MVTLEGNVFFPYGLKFVIYFSWLFIYSFFSYEFDFCNLVLLLNLSYFYQYLNWPFEMIVFAKSSLISN